MPGLFTKPDLEQKLEILSTDSQYDLACACGTNSDDRRHRGENGKWIYPVSLPNGGKSIIFKSLISNVCNNNCNYCPLRKSADIKRCSLSVDEIANVFLDYYYAGKVFGLFLSSGVMGTVDNTMDKLCGVAEILRKKHRYKGFIHLKVIPGASDAAVYKAASLASALSVNIEVPGPERMKTLSADKNFTDDIIRPMKIIRDLGLEMKGKRKLKQTTQFIVGAAGETDAEIVKYTSALYNRMKMQRIYFSAYQSNLGRALSENAQPNQSFVREHRLYQVDFLFRKYGFEQNDIFFNDDGSLNLEDDPKQVWASRNPHFFPVRINTAPKADLLKVPGFGPITVNRIIKRRTQGRIGCLEDVAKPNKTNLKSLDYIIFD